MPHIYSQFEMTQHLDFLRSIYDRIQKAAAQTQFTTYQYGKVHDWPLVAYINSKVDSNRPWIYVSAGVHGDEPGAVLGLVQAWEQGLFDQRFNWIICPLINPAGHSIGQRENATGVDLNRDYKSPQTLETQSHTKWLSKHIPDKGLFMSLCLHEDWEAKGPYLYFLNRHKNTSLAESTLQAMDKILPRETAEEIDEMPAENGLIHVSEGIDQFREERSDWPETFYLWPHSLQSMTIETPSAEPLDTRARTHYAALEHIFQQLDIQKSETES